MFCARTKDGLSKFDHRRETVFATFLKEPDSVMMYIYTAPQLDHKACNMTLDDIDYDSVAKQLNGAAKGVVTKEDFSDTAKAVWSVKFDLKSLEELEGTGPRFWTSEGSEDSSSEKSSSDESLSDTPTDSDDSLSDVSMSNSSSDSDSSSDNECPSTNGPNINPNSASGFKVGYASDDNISDPPSDHDSSSDNVSSSSSSTSNDSMNIFNVVNDYKTIGTSYTNRVMGRLHLHPTLHLHSACRLHPTA
jgi:hypothetical protein